MLTDRSTPLDGVSFPPGAGTNLRAWRPETALADSTFFESLSRGTLSPAWKALRRLELGNARFIEDRSKPRGSIKARRFILARGQNPKAMIFSCSDSRVPPTRVFDQQIGDLFSIRTPGYVISEATLAGVEFGLRHLKIPLLVILGHEGCGAVRAALSTRPGESAGSPNLDYVIDHVRGLLPPIPKVPPGEVEREPGKREMISMSKAYAEAIASEIIRSSAITEAAVAAKELLVVSAFYHLRSGRVEFLSIKTGRPVQ